MHKNVSASEYVYEPDDSGHMPKVRLPKTVHFNEKEYHLMVYLPAPYMHVVAYREGKENRLDDYLFWTCRDTIEECVTQAKTFFRRLRNRRTSGKVAENASRR